MSMPTPRSAAGVPLHEALSHEPRARFGDVLALGFVLDLLPVGIVLLDGYGRLGWTNRRAQERIAEGDPLLVRDGRLLARSHRDTLALHRLVERACATARRGEVGEPEVLVVSPAGAGGRVVVVGRAVERLEAAVAAGAAQAVLFLSDPEHQLRASPQRLRQLFGLTPAESDLTALLASGCSLSTAADQLAITTESARTYLKRALSKTGTRRQAELVRLVLSVATAGASET